MKEKENTNIVKYHNDLNELTFQRFGQVDFDFFMVLCAKLKDSGSNRLVISFDEFKKLAGYSPKNSEARFINSLQSMNQKQLLSTGLIRQGNKIKQFVLFTEFEIDPDEKTITAKVNSDYMYILNEVTKSFTRFELEEFIRLESKYSKTLYRLLKQFRTTGIYRVTLDEFKRLFGVSKGYSNKLIMQKIITPSVKALKPHFTNLECVPLYEKKPGRPVKGYEFTFEPETVPRIGPAPEQPERKKQRKPKNAFHNFEQREYDYDDLERRLIEKQQGK